ncbi:MAG: pyridoxal phosphate-dependent aminotransferase [Chloroflexi bacterium]|nr:pyridoxal phosphate-dependent aminotransferase [Chloroflexota bacterium]MBM3182700.1 pyridoxal phosphate-dependent aminotransferase [Chloroflexota bacterium]MBM4452322.1 pyridoxal phosphate-dependent aminotransferase [Chloroflexota bacterium]MBM4453918.1 pyridoxal phosphate-dependent aminotransferase [Chloroflexota bacterium]
MSISDSVRQRMAQGSMIRRMFEEGNLLKQKLGADKVFDLSIGNPVMDPPQKFYEELRRLAEKPLAGMHRYMENAGYAHARSAVAEGLSGETGPMFKHHNIVMTCGAAGALNVVLKAILNPGEEVIVFAPYFLEYGNYIDNHGGVARVVPTDDSFLPKLDALEAAITPSTKAVIINSPNNPTGVVYSEDMIGSLGRLLGKKQRHFGTHIYLISDEAYRKLIYDGLKYPPVFPHHRQSIVVTSHSKDLALPGERIGYIAVHPECAEHDDLMNALIFCNRTLGFVNAPALMQHLVSKLQNVTVSVAEYQKKRDFLYSNLVRMGYSVVKPQGAFYMFPKSPTKDEVEFLDELRQWNVLAVPGSGFGTPGYFRIAYCVEDKTLEGAIAGLEKAARKFKLC